MCLFQSRGLSEGCIVRVMKNCDSSLWDFKMIFIDLRIDSPTYKSVDVIDVKPGRAVFVPGGVANGAQSLVNNGILNYLVADYYDPHKKFI